MQLPQRVRPEKPVQLLAVDLNGVVERGAAKAVSPFARRGVEVRAAVGDDVQAIEEQLEAEDVVVAMTAATAASRLRRSRRTRARDRAAARKSRRRETQRIAPVGGVLGRRQNASTASGPSSQNDSCQHRDSGCLEVRPSEHDRRRREQIPMIVDLLRRPGSEFARRQHRRRAEPGRRAWCTPPRTRTSARAAPNSSAADRHREDEAAHNW